MEKQESEQLNRMIRYFNKQLEKRDIWVNSCFHHEPKKLEIGVLFYSDEADEDFPIELEFNSWYLLESPEVLPHCDEIVSHLVLSAGRIEKVIKKGLIRKIYTTSCDFSVEGLEGELFSANIWDKVNHISVGNNQLAEKYRIEIEKLTGQDYRAAFDLGFKMYD